MNERAFFDDLQRRGIRLIAESGVIKWTAPQGAMTVADIRRIKDDRPQLLALLRDRDRFTVDPRPDLTEDTADWCALLVAVYDHDGHDANGTFGNLHGLRCLGCRLIRDERGSVRIDRGDELTQVDYATYKALYLLPRTDQIRRLLAGLAERPVAA